MIELMTVARDGEWWRIHRYELVTPRQLWATYRDLIDEDMAGVALHYIPRSKKVRWEWFISINDYAWPADCLPKDFPPQFGEGTFVKAGDVASWQQVSRKAIEPDSTKTQGISGGNLR